MTRENTGRRRPAPHEAVFSCRHCGRLADMDAPGTRHRNHCPSCLSSLHVDIRVGDRRSSCRARMEPIAVWVRDDGEWALVHRCTGCGKLNANRVAGDDDEAALHALATRPAVVRGHPGRYKGAERKEAR